MAILVVDNEPVVSEIVCSSLTRYGYRTVAAANAREALQFAASKPRLELLLTEVVLPDMSGPALARAVVQALDPAPAAMFMSAFPRPEMPPEIPFIQKPFTTQVLVSRVEAVLNEAAKARNRLGTTLVRGWELLADARTLLAETEASRREAAETHRRSQQLRARWAKNQNR